MKRITLTLLIGIFLLSACGGATTTPQPIISSATDYATTTFTAVPTSTQTSIPPTASITPLPTIPTFTPTFDVSTIVTVTPAPQAECPELSPNEFAQSLAKELMSLKAPMIIDLTNDGAPEVILDGNRDFQHDGDGSINIFGCQNGSYIELQQIQTLGLPLPWVATIQDLNGNGTPEVVTIHNECMFSRCKIIRILEWRNSAFIDVSRDPSASSPLQSEVLEDISFADIDGNGTIEVIVSEGMPLHQDSLMQGPLRKYTSIFSWDGKFFNLVSVEMSPPEYRFQAIQDADKKVGKRGFNEAIELYHEAISNDRLKSWSPIAAGNYRAWVNNLYSSQPTPTPVPSDATEYPRLASYAYYRILLIHLVQGNQGEATTTYTKLGQTFGADPYARPYVEMAIAFWEAYQSTHKMYDACAAAIQYAAEHPEILTPLGSDYHGAQSHIYKPEDVCPFR